MSRNLCRTDCHVCHGEVRLVERDRPATAADVGRYAAQYLGMLVAHAACVDCETPYLAWVDERTRTSPLYHEGDRWARGEGAFVDLSYRSAFNDEPDGNGADDPRYEVVRVRVPVATAARWRAGECSHGRDSCAACWVHRGRAIGKLPTKGRP